MTPRSSENIPKLYRCYVDTAYIHRCAGNIASLGQPYRDDGAAGLSLVEGLSPSSNCPAVGILTVLDRRKARATQAASTGYTSAISRRRLCDGVPRLYPKYRGYRPIVGRQVGPDVRGQGSIEHLTGSAESR